MAERSRLQGLATRAASALADALQRAGRLPEAADAAERALELSPCDETIFRNLIRLLIAADNPARVEAVAHGFVERLALDLGVAPSAETMRLIREARGRRNAEPIVVIGPRAQAIRKDRQAIDSVTASIIAHGRHHWHQRTRSAIERAIEYFTRALERDPRSVDALCGIADSWIVMGGRGYVPVATAIDHAARSVERARALDDASSSVFMSLGGLNVLRSIWRERMT
jgi:tetratricopeptide (TPR) repeat protein